MTRLLKIISLACSLHLALTVPATAAIYDLPPEGQDVIGAVSTVVATYDDTLVDIALIV